MSISVHANQVMQLLLQCQDSSSKVVVALVRTDMSLLGSLYQWLGPTSLVSNHCQRWRTTICDKRKPFLLELGLKPVDG